VRGYRTVMNCNAEAGQSVFMCICTCSRRPMRWPPAECHINWKKQFEHQGRKNARESKQFNSSHLHLMVHGLLETCIRFSWCAWRSWRFNGVF